MNIMVYTESASMSLNMIVGKEKDTRWNGMVVLFGNGLEGVEAVWDSV